MESRDPDDPCTSKRGAPKKRWARENAAVFVANYIYSTKGALAVVYHCNGCGGWHTASARSRQEKREAQRRLEAAGIWDENRANTEHRTDGILTDVRAVM